MKISYFGYPDLREDNKLEIRRLIVDKPTSMPEMHYHPFYEIYVLVEGQRKYFLSDRILLLDPGSVLIIKPNEPHRAIPLSDEKYERFIINVHPDMIKRLLSYNNMLKKVVEHSFFKLPNLVDELKLFDKMKYQNEKKDEFSESILRHYLEEFFITLATKGTVMLTSNAFQKNDIRIQDALNYISSNYNKKITVNDCAEISCMSTKTFMRIFKEIINTSFKTYVNTIRINKACELLEKTLMPVIDIALEVGFTDSANFSTVFKKYTGVTPTDYRIQCSYE